ncbi:polymer-forming cytoskeletal protein [Agrobacterium rubi]|nr:polymer-forming cytoskeletal protein [Agrobacterium rubi]NTF24409.1 polymer-forming cytoskeletal protein [Agrobacterium rubi]
MANAEINNPDDDVDIDYEFAGHIRCRHLTILEGGSVTGTVVASRVDVKGALHGVADCDDFRALPPAVIRGTVFAPSYNIRDKGDREADAVVLHSSTRQHIFRTVARPALPEIDEVINLAIDEAVAERIGSAAVEPKAKDDTGRAGSIVADELDLSLSDRLARKGLSSLIPVVDVDEEPVSEVPAELPVPRPVHNSRMPLPSLV